MLTVKWYYISVHESNKVLQTEVLFSGIFLSRWWPCGTVTEYYYVQKAPGQYPTNRKRKSKSWS